jgi:hypothetical protein
MTNPPTETAELLRLLDDPQGQAQFMLSRLDEAQREFIVRMKPHLRHQRVSKRDHEAVWPGVQTGAEWPDQFWFGGGCAYYPAGRPPIGNRRSRYSFRFNEAGLLIRTALEARTTEEE